MVGKGARAAAPGSAGPTVDWNLRGVSISVRRPVVMGILNLTPDSFSDGGELATPGAAVERGLAMIEAGADLLDLGAESTRPGARAIEPEHQLERLLPVIEGLAARTSVPLSLDTRSSVVARQGLAAGAAAVNDVSALSDPDMAEVVQEAGAGVVLMHMRGTPETMQSRAAYGDVVAEVRSELANALDRALAAGIAAERIVLDPGIGFAKTAEQSLTLLGALDRLTALGRPLLVGPSRKSFIRHVVGDGVPPRARLGGTVAACVVALLGGARIFRVHDIAPVWQALEVAAAILQTSSRER